MKAKQENAYAMDLNNISLPFNRSGIIADVNIGYKGFTFELEMIDISGSTRLNGNPCGYSDQRRSGFSG